MTDTAKATVLIIDDHEDSREVYRVLLEVRGYRVILAETGAEGRRLLEEEEPDLLLLDRKLPGMDGLDLLPHVDETTRVICVSAQAFSEDRREALDAGADRYLTKPVSPVDVLREMEALLEPGSPGE